MSAARPALPRPSSGLRRMLLAASVTAALAGLAMPARALDLAEAFTAAERYDTQVNSARQQLEAVRERLPQARAGLRPALAGVASANVGRFDTDIAEPRSFDNITGGLNFSFPLYRPGNGVLIDQAEIGVRIAEAQLAQSLQDLVARVASAYLDVLSAMDAVEVSESQRRAITEQFEAAKRNFEVGTATVTDQQEAQARLDLNAAQLAAARNDLTLRRAALAQLTGLDPNVPLNTLKLDVPLPEPQPNDLGYWITQARASSFAVRQAELAVANARKEIERARYAKQPVVDLISQAALVNGKTASSVNSLVDRSTTLSAGIQLSVPLYSGGALDARERETVAALNRAETDLESLRRQSDQAARQAYLGLKSSTEQARALEAAVRSSRLALESNLLGYQVGVRINVDVLNSQQQLFQAYRDLARARYDVLINTLRLKATAGMLQGSDVVAANTLLSPPAERNFPVLDGGPGRASPGGGGATSGGTGTGAGGTRPGTSGRPGAPAPVLPRDFGGRVTKPVPPGEPRPSPRAPMPR